MEIGGFQKTTLLDYPGHVAATVFTVGCNYRCPFCQNAGLVLGKSKNAEILERIPEVEVLSYLAKRKNVLEGVCISGGEPTLQRDLATFCYQLKNLGYLVKLDTNGSNPKVIRELYEANLIDYVAMDVKAGREKYRDACGLVELCELQTINQSVNFLMDSGIDYEFRTTLVKGLHTKEDIEDLGNLLAGAKRYFLQNYKDSDSVLWKAKNFAPFSKTELEGFLEILLDKVPKTCIRGEE